MEAVGLTGFYAAWLFACVPKKKRAGLDSEKWEE